MSFMKPDQTTANGIDECDDSLVQTQDTHRTKFEETVQEVLNDQEHDQLFIAFLLDIKQFHLESMFDTAFIVNEAYKRGIEKLAKGEELGGGNYRGWLRSCGRNIIRELSREFNRDLKKTDPLSAFKLETLTAKPTTSWLSETAGTAKHKVIKKAFAQLSQLEQSVLYAKVVDGWRWKDIRETLIQSGYEPMTENYLSQIKHRALKKLKAYFEEAQNVR
jgi:DNA-directed RNA polymerase specialized sigma24 family protein